MLFATASQWVYRLAEAHTGGRLQAGDEIHVFVRSTLPIDPQSVRVHTTAEYVDLYLTDPKTGIEYHGTPHCTRIDTEANGSSDGSACTIDPGAPGSDPLKAHPIAGSVIKQLVELRRGLEHWGPAQVQDPTQRVRNYLYVAAVPDVFQIPLERFAPLLIFDRLQKEFAERDLVRLLYWVARHPAEGDDSALAELHALGLGAGPSDTEQTRERVVYYAVKLLGRLTGKIAAG